LRRAVQNCITDVPGIKVGHYTDTEAATGCTVVLCESGAVPGVDVSGAAPGSRETEVVRPGSSVERVHAVVLSGGSAYGLDAAGGAMKYLEERGIGFQTRAALVPIVPAAIIYDLGIGSPRARPGVGEGYQACLAAGEGKVEEGCAGAGTGATVGKCLGMERATKSGLGTASRELDGGVVVAALMVVNAFGDVIDPRSGRVVAGPRNDAGDGFLSTSALFQAGRVRGRPSTLNTVIGVVAGNVRLGKEQAGRLARAAQVGVARTIDPCGTEYDGDTIFWLSLGEKRCDISRLGAAAAEVVAEAVLRAVRQAGATAGIPAARDVVRGGGE